MRIVGQIQFWRGCVIYLYNFFFFNAPHPPSSPAKGFLEGGGGHPEHIPVFRALLKTTDPHQKVDLVHTKFGTRSTPEHIPVFRALLETTDQRRKADSVHVKMQTLSTLKNCMGRGQTHRHTNGHRNY